MKVTASAKFIRISPRKARLVVDAVRGLSASEAERVLQVMNKKSAEPVLKLLRSAIANAQQNFQLQKENLFIAEIVVNEGMTIKRFMPRAFGRASGIRKRTSHFSIALEEKKEVQKEKKGKVVVEEKKEKTETVAKKKPALKKKTTEVKAKGKKSTEKKKTDKKNRTE